MTEPSSQPPSGPPSPQSPGEASSNDTQFVFHQYREPAGSYGSGGPYGADPFAPPPGSYGGPMEHPQARRGVAMVAAVALVAGLFGGVAGAWLENRVDSGPAVNSLAQPVSEIGTTQRPAGSVAQVAATVLPSVVLIKVAAAGRAGAGTGFVISSDGLVVTNNHVVQPAEQTGGGLIVSFQDGRSVEGRIVGRDPSSDLAVIRVEGVDNLRPVRLGRSADLVVGDQVVAIGAPLGLAGTVTTGIVSALNRPVRAGGGEGGLGAEDQSAVLNAIQTDAPINPGNSGGPLVNMRGEIIAINSAIATLGGGQLGAAGGSIGLGFAIPIDSARRVADELARSGRATRTVMGVKVRNQAPGGGTGAVLEGVDPDQPADVAGLKPGDVVTKFGGRVIDSADALVAAVRSEEPGRKVPVTFTRAGKSDTVDVVLKSSPSS
jgi:putative serine protease PepD